jgi:CheY-like chemotaxis protein
MDLLTAKTILVAEDDDFTRRVLATVLARMGARVIECVHGQQALTVLRDRRVDMALLDVLMPHVNGLCVLQAIRSGGTLQDFATPVLLLTATREEAVVHFAAALSCNGFLLKPVNRADLTNRLGKIAAQQMAMPYVPQHYCKIDVGPPDQPPRMPASRKKGLTVLDLNIGMVFSAPVTSMGRTIAPQGTMVNAELLVLLAELARVAPVDPIFVSAEETAS